MLIAEFFYKGIWKLGTPVLFFLSRHKEKNQKKKLVACGVIRALRFSPAPGFLEHNEARDPAQREIHAALFAMLADNSNGDTPLWSPLPGRSVDGG